MKSAVQKPVAVVKLTGAVKAQQAWDIESLLAELSTKNRYKAIADLTGVSHLSSSVLGLLARFAEECRQNNGELRLVVTEQGVLNLLQVTMLDKVFEIYTSVEEAEEDF